MLYLASDHAGYPLKTKLIQYLVKLGAEFEDLGTNSTESVDFPVFCDILTQKVVLDPRHRGILICGSGVGMSICANRQKGIRAALCLDTATVRLAREHNDANVLVLAGRKTSAFRARSMLKVFLNTPSLGGKYQRRMQMIDA